MKRFVWPVVFVLPWLLSGCGLSDEEELQAWMQEQRTQLHPKVTPVTPPKPFTPELYVESEALEPFSKEKLLLVYKRDLTLAKNNALLAPELGRRKEALESIPLDNMVMTGFMMKAGKPVALVKAGSLLYQVRVGNYLGQSYGRVVQINETEVVLREIAQEVNGEWKERPASLQLQGVVK